MEDFKEYLIEKIMELKQADQILIDCLKVDLMELAEKELKKRKVEDLKMHLDNILEDINE